MAGKGRQAAVPLHVDLMLTHDQAVQFAENYSAWCRERGIDWRKTKLEDCKTVDDFKAYAEKAKLMEDFIKEALTEYYHIVAVGYKIADVPVGKAKPK